MWWFNNKIPKYLPTATGPYLPGCKDVMIDYSINGIFLRLYYPTDAKKNQKNYKKWIPWIPDDSYIVGIAKVLMSYIFVIRAAVWWSGNIHIPVLNDEKIKTSDKLKCVILSHGLGGHRFLYSNFCSELASRGYLVAAIEHRDNSASNTYYYQSKENAERDIRTVITHKHIEFGKNHYEKRNEQVNKRAKECGQVLDFLIDLHNGNIPHNILDDVPASKVNKEGGFNLEDLVGNLDLNSLTMAGHSFGGATTLLTLSKRQELKQGILLDPWMFPIKNDNLEEKIEQPLIFINTQTFHITSNVDAMSKYLTSDKRKMYTILHTTHENQTDSVLIIGYWLNWFMKKLDPLHALKINNGLALKFLKCCADNSCDIADCDLFLEEHKKDYVSGLTKPWA